MAIEIQLHFQLCAGVHGTLIAGKFRWLDKNWQVPPFSLLRAGKIIAKAKVIQNARSKMGTMAENHAHPAGSPAMDYAEHEKLTGCFSSS
jgi:hypothetical protein